MCVCVCAFFFFIGEITNFNRLSQAEWQKAVRARSPKAIPVVRLAGPPLPKPEALPKKFVYKIPKGPGAKPPTAHREELAKAENKRLAVVAKAKPPQKQEPIEIDDADEKGTYLEFRQGHVQTNGQLKDRGAKRACSLIGPGPQVGRN